MSAAVSVVRVGQKRVESYKASYIVEERGWRVEITGVDSIANDQLARLLISEADIQTMRWLAGRCGASKNAELPRIDVRRLVRSKPFQYEIGGAS